MQDIEMLLLYKNAKMHLSKQKKFKILQFRNCRPSNHHPKIQDFVGQFANVRKILRMPLTPLQKMHP